jgi:membrane associated rhomboid family serine protease
MINSKKPSKLVKMSKKEKALAYTKTEMLQIIRGTFEYKKIFIIYSLVLLISLIFFAISQVYPFTNNILSASRTTPWGIITSIFAHVSFSHITLNMGSLFLFMFFFLFVILLNQSKLRKE